MIGRVEDKDIGKNVFGIQHHFTCREMERSVAEEVHQAGPSKH
jgi:hypothetical protein